MPTYDPLPRFWRDYEHLSEDEKKAFMEAVESFKRGLETGEVPRGLSLHKLQGAGDVWAISWGTDNDGRATFSYGDEVEPGEPHIIWRRVGTHKIYGRP